MHKYEAVKHSKTTRLITCSVVGARGYSGQELVKLLLQHPGVELKSCFATSDFKLSDIIDMDGIDHVACLNEKQVLNAATDIVFLATPAETSLELAPQLIAGGSKVIDLSGAFRLKKNSYDKWYGLTHTQPELNQSSVYGLVPWSGPASKESKLIANPGCYATAIAMALIPLLKRNLIDEKSIVIDAKSGATGAGKKASETLLFTEVADECLPYRIGRHQHLPEIIETVEAHTGKVIDPHFSTHLLPIRRGLIAGIYANANTTDAQQIQRAFVEEYFSYPLVKCAPLSSARNPASMKKVVGTPHTQISFELVGQKLFVFSLIDNLLKGAASQAVENLNRILDLPVQTGLLTRGGIT